MQPIILTNENFESEIASDEPILVDFWATWCGPCKMLSPLVDEVAEQAQNFKVGKVNVDEQGQIAQKYGIAAIPTLLVFKKGEVIKKSVGYIEKNEILDLLK